ncbi:1-aminocyclopropane-1-carboxylate oxidase-like protein, partial [Trifolium pratense]
MVVKNTDQLEEATNLPYDREAEVKAFDDSKAGVNGLVESGVSKIPRMFHTGKLDITKIAGDSKLSVPIVDLKDIHANPALRVEVIDKIRSACHEWGFFQVINHGIHVTVLDEMINGIRSFHEQDVDVRKEFYTRDLKKKVTYYSNGTLYSGQAANWRDTFAFGVAPDPVKPNELPPICRIPTLRLDSIDSSLESKFPSQLVSRAFDLARMMIAKYKLCGTSIAASYKYSNNMMDSSEEEVEAVSEGLPQYEASSKENMQYSADNLKANFLTAPPKQLDRVVLPASSLNLSLPVTTAKQFSMLQTSLQMFDKMPQ